MPPAGSVRIHAEQGLAELDRLAVLDQDLDDRSRDSGRDVGEDFHRLDDADGRVGRTTEPTVTNGGASGELEA